MFVSACIRVHVHSVCVCVKQVRVCQGVHVEVRDQPLTLFDIGCFCCYFAVVSSCLASRDPPVSPVFLQKHRDHRCLCNEPSFYVGSRGLSSGLTFVFTHGAIVLGLPALVP